MTTKEEKIKLLNIKISSVFILTNLAYTLLDDAEDLAKGFGGFRFELKKELNSARASLDRMMQPIRKEVSFQGRGRDFMSDFDKLEKIVQDFISDIGLTVYGKDEITFKAKGVQRKSVKIDSSLDWHVRATSDWVKIEIEAYGIFVSVDENNGEERKSEIIVNSGLDEKRITIIQQSN